MRGASFGIHNKPLSTRPKFMLISNEVTFGKSLMLGGAESLRNQGYG